MTRYLPHIAWCLMLGALFVGAYDFYVVHHGEQRVCTWVKR